MTTPVSVALIAKDAARTLDGVLASVAWADDVVIILDERTSDASEDIARRHGARVERHPWRGHVAQKNVALAAARHEWVLSLDADEEVSPALQQALASWRAAPPDPAVAGYEVSRLSYHLGRWIRHGGWYPDVKLRLVDRRRARWVGLDPHDRLEVEGVVRRLAGDLHHYSYADLHDHLARSERYSTIAAQAMYDAGRRASWLDILVRPPWRFVSGYFVLGGVFDGAAGFAIAYVGAMGVAAKYLKLRELARAQRAGTTRS